MTESEPAVIALDGPAGSGKSTVARMLADRLGMVHADSGAIYRALTYAAMQSYGPDFASSFTKDGPDQLQVSVQFENGSQVAYVDGRAVVDEIRTPEVTARIKIIADDVRCRDVVNRLLREFAKQTSLVVDGRDMGTVVFPDTPFKFFLEASVEVRAARRAAEFEKKGSTMSMEKVQSEIASRDQQDRNRSVGALKQADNAILIDTSRLDPEAVVSTILSHLQVQF